MENQIPGQTVIESSGAGEMLNLEGLIKNHVKSIDDLKVELKQTREMYQDSFNNNPTFKEHDDRVKEATKLRNSVKQQIAKQPSVALLEQKVKDIRFDISEKKKTMSDLLLDYKEQTGATQLELFSGETFAIAQTARLIKVSK